jgi:hypothetical protein
MRRLSPVDQVTAPFAIGNGPGASQAFSGRITDPGNTATYSGKLPVDGNNLKLKGCATHVLHGLLSCIFRVADYCEAIYTHAEI